MKKNPALIIVAVVAFAAAATIPAEAKLPWLKKSKPLDAGVTSCQSCHVNAKPKKGEALSERGQWLVDQKATRTAKEIDLAWLSEFPKNGQNLDPAKQ